MDDDITISSIVQKKTSEAEIRDIASERGWTKDQLEYAIKERFGHHRFAIEKEEKQGFFEEYCGLISNDWGEVASDNLRKTVEESSKRLTWQKTSIQENRSGYGLVVGRIQSGKTAHIIGLSMLAMDETINGPGLAFNTVIVLSGLLEDLRRQTFQRFSEMKISGCRVFPRKSDFTDKNDEAKEELLEAFSSIEPCILVVKKNHIVIEAIMDYLAEDEIKSQLGERRVLIIDDECDHASIDSGHAESDEESRRITATNRAVRGMIRNLLTSMDNQWYLGYTATPYSNLLMDPEPEFLDQGLGPSLFPRDMIHLLPRPLRKGISEKNHHFDNQDFFSGDGVPYICEKEIPAPGGGDERDHIRNIILMHVISKILRETGGEVKDHTTMIHTDTSKLEHLRVAQIVKEINEQEYLEIDDVPAVAQILECAGRYYPEEIKHLEGECNKIVNSTQEHQNLFRRSKSFYSTPMKNKAESITHFLPI